MAAQKKWITKKEIEKLIRSYSVRPNEFEPFGNEGYSFKSRYAKGYTISLEQEIQHGNEKTGRILVSHTKGNGERTYCDIWEWDFERNLQFVFRNPRNVPFTDYSCIHDLETQIKELKEAGCNRQNQLKDSPETPGHLQQELNLLKIENETLRNQVSSLEKKVQELINKTQHNARGAGRKADPQKLEDQAKKLQSLLADGKSASEIQETMGISRSTFFRYKKILNS